MSIVSRLPVSIPENSIQSFNHSIVTGEGEGGRNITGSNSLVLKVTDCRSEREQALKLVHRVYCQSGLTEGNSAGMRVLRQHLADETEIMVVKQHGKVIFTVTLVRDGIYGLPLESLFGEEVEHMRSQGLRVAEVSCLAHDCDLTENRARFDTFVQGMGLMAQTARRRKVDRLLLAVHPRHAKVYERLFGCVRCSDTKEYAAVRGNPAILCVHDFAACDITRYPLFNQIYANAHDPWQMDGARMSEREKQYFEQFLPSVEYDLVPMAA